MGFEYRLWVMLCVLSLLPTIATPNTILELNGENSRISFGTSDVEHVGLGFSTPGPWEDWGNTFVAYSGAFLDRTLEKDAGGLVNGRYLYDDGGTFEMFFDLRRSDTGEVRQGSFIAPILPIEVFTTDFPLPCDFFCGGVDVRYELGPGVFDTAIADALGVRRRTQGGFVSDPYLLLFDFPYTDPTAPEREAFEGAPLVRIDVPEPALTSLLAVALGLAGHRARRRRRLSKYLQRSVGGSRM
jgi:hypothetical protein